MYLPLLLLALSTLSIATTDTLNGGAPPAFSDTLNGGAPPATGTDTLNGGAPPAPPMP
jgi:hypothetical protein